MDEAYIEMRCYIKYNLYYGQGEQAIRQSLVNAGWPAKKISQAFMELKGIPTQEAKPVQKQGAKAEQRPAAAPKAPAAKKEAPKEELSESPTAAPAPPGK